jgi:hypothetical protein
MPLTNLLKTVVKKFRRKPILPSWLEYNFNGWMYREDQTHSTSDTTSDKSPVELIKNHDTTILIKNDPELEQRLTDLAWFYGDMKIISNPMHKERGIRMLRNYLRKSINMMGRTVTLLCYVGPPIIYYREDLSTKLLPNMVNGYRFAQQTEIFNDDFFRECLDRKQNNQNPSQIYRWLLQNVDKQNLTAPFHEKRRYNPSKVSNSVYLIDIKVKDILQGLHLSTKIQIATLQHYYEKGLSYAFAFARLVGLSKLYLAPEQAAMDLQEYVQKISKIKSHKEYRYHPDHTVEFHQKTGGEIIVGLPDCRPEDRQSFGCAALIIYDLKKIEKEEKLIHY